MIYLLACLLVFICCGFNNVLAEQKEEKLPEIVVKGEKIAVPSKQTAETVYTGTELTSKGIELSGQKGNGI